jgi:hypothetical protein
MSDHDYADPVAARAAMVQRSELDRSEHTESAPPAQATEVDRVVCRAGDASCAAAHAAALGPSVHRSASRGSVMRLQRQYGNRYARQVLSLARQTEPESAGADVERSIDAARGGGQHLDAGVRSSMEPSYGADFGGVKVHTDSRADGLSRSLNAKAFTTGKDIFFRQGEYNPGTSSGRELLAHELTHVVQQNGSGISRKMSVSQPGDAHEVEAESMARAVMQQEQRPAREADRMAVSRAEQDEAQAKADPAALQRQPEAPHDKLKEEEEKKKLHAKLDQNGVSRQADEERKE